MREPRRLPRLPRLIRFFRSLRFTALAVRGGGLRSAARAAGPLLLIVAGLAGCATPPAATAGDGTAKPRTTRPTAPPGSGTGDGPSETALALRAQADRDMEALRELRRKVDVDPGSATDDDDAPDDRLPAGSTPPLPRPAIEWNDAGALGSGAAAPQAPSTLARPEESVGVRPVPPAAPPALTASEQLELDTLGMRLVQLRQDLYRESIDSEQPVRELLAIAAMAIVNPDLELPQGAERNLTAEELELLDQLHRFFIDLGRKLDDEHEAQQTIIDAVLSLQNAIVKRPALELPTVALCWRIGGFGDYDKFEREAFLAHDEQQVILYLEIDGFTSVLNERRQWVTQISQQLEIYSDRDGIPVWSESWQRAVDVINNKRRDFFTTQLITLPAALSVGRYQLKIRVRDEESGAEAEASIPFEMVADPRLAAQVGR